MSRLFYFTVSYFHKIIPKEMYIIPLLFLCDEGVQRPYIALSLYSALILSRISDPIYILLLPHMRTCIPESTEEHKREAAPHGQIDIDITHYSIHSTLHIPHSTTTSNGIPHGAEQRTRNSSTECHRAQSTEGHIPRLCHTTHRRSSRKRWRCAAGRSARALAHSGVH